MELKEVIHFYLNPFNKTKIRVDGNEEMYLWDIDVAEGGYVNFTAAKKEFRSINHEDDGWMVYNDDETLSRMKPILRRLSSMTEEEAIEIVKINEFKQYGGHPTERKYSTYENSFGQIVVSWGDGLKEKNIPQSKEVFDPIEFHYLISKHFDLFSLIESNQAIDRDTLTNQSK